MDYRNKDKRALKDTTTKTLPIVQAKDRKQHF